MSKVKSNLGFMNKLACLFNVSTENLGFNVEGGEFVYAHKDKTEPQSMLNIVKGMKEMGLPMLAANSKCFPSAVTV